MSSGFDFVEVRRWPVRVLVRPDLVHSLGEWLLQPHVTPPPEATTFATGRGGAWAFTLADGRRAVFREYRRGGLLARWVERTYMGVEARPFRELAVASRAHQRGIPTAEVLAARAVGRLLYRGAIVTLLIPGARPVLAALRAAQTPADRVAIAAAAGRAVGMGHRLGLAHADLNCDNLLITRSSSGVEARVIDLDRARLVEPPLGARERGAALARLARSLRKLDSTETVGTEPVRAAFRAGYEEAAHLPCAC